MGLAGDVKLKTFLLAVGGVAALGAGGLYLAADGGDEVSTAPRVETFEPTPAPSAGDEVRPGVTINRGLDGATDAGETEAAAADVAAPDVAEPAPAAAEGPPTLRRDPVEAAVLGWKQRSIPVKKKKDVSKGRAWKINVYQDDPGAGVNRAKVDLDRDDAWDHKYTFEPDGGVTRKVAPNDDENYTVQERLTDAGWVPAQ